MTDTHQSEYIKGVKGIKININRGLGVWKNYPLSSKPDLKTPNINVEKYNVGTLN